MPQKTETRSRATPCAISCTTRSMRGRMRICLPGSGMRAQSYLPRRRNLTGGTASLPTTARIRPAAVPPSPCRRRPGSLRSGSTPGSSPAHSGPPCRSGSGGRTAARRVRSTRRPPCWRACCSAAAADRCMPNTAARQTVSAFPMSAVRNRPADGNNAAARTFLALQQTPPCAPCSAPCRRTAPHWQQPCARCAAACRSPSLRRRTVSPLCSAIAWTPSAGRSASLRP